MKLRRQWFAADDGYATAEFALTLPTIIVVIALGLGVFSAGAAKIQTCAQARSAARALSIGQEVTPVRGITTQAKENEEWITVQASTTLGGRSNWLPQIRCETTTIREPDYGAFY